MRALSTRAVIRLLTNLSIYTTKIAHAFERGLETHSIYTDFSKAFDTVEFNVLLPKLKSIGIDGTLLKWIDSYISDRSLQVVFNGSKSNPFTPTSGVPQGSILGPLLFNIFINDLGGLLKCEHLFFADDLKIYKTINCQGDVDKLSNDLITLNSWCLQNGLKLNIGRCKFISFNNKSNPIQTHYAIGNEKLEEVKCIKDLGIIFDNKLKFDSHMDVG